MSTRLRVIERPDDYRPYGGTHRDLAPGDMWRDPEMDADGIEAWAIVLPNRTVWYTTMRAGGSDSRWTVAGTPPDISVTPSIDDRDPHNGWHGWITNGEMTP